MKYGYARCSTNEDKQDIQRQVHELKAVGAEKVIFEYEHGDAKIKQNLQLLLDTARAGTLWNALCRRKGEANRTQAHDEGRYSRRVLSPLSILPERKPFPFRTGARLRIESANGL